MSEEKINKPPHWLNHKPIVSVDYPKQCKFAGDARFLTLGRSTWDKDSYSAKIWRWVETEKGERWSRQSEEIPLWRLLDLATLFLATALGKESGLNEQVLDENEKACLDSFISENMDLYRPRIDALMQVLSGQEIVEDCSEGSPNLFSFATSELSQDAVLAYILQWSDVKNKNTNPQMHALGQALLRCMLGDYQRSIENVVVGRQMSNIDIYAEVNDDVFLIIEDKTNTTIHSNQLERYKEFAENRYKGMRQVKMAYVKTGNEPKQILEKVKNAGYRAVLRQDLLKVLNQYAGAHPMIAEYRAYLQNIEDRTQSYKTIPVKDWDKNSICWQGLYKSLENKIERFSWNHVHNQTGGFWCATFKWLEIPDGGIYLQMGEGKLSFKIEYWGPKKKSYERNRLYWELDKLAKNKSFAVSKPARFGSGEHMTFMEVSCNDLYGKGLVDEVDLVNKLNMYEQILEELAQNVV